MKVALVSEYSPRNITITQEEYVRIYPDCHVARKLTVLFPHRITEIQVEQEIALYLALRRSDIAIKGISRDALERIAEGISTIERELGREAEIEQPTIIPENEEESSDTPPEEKEKMEIIEPFSENGAEIVKDELDDMTWVQLQKKAASLNVYDKKFTRTELIERIRAINEKG